MASRHSTAYQYFWVSPNKSVLNWTQQVCQLLWYSKNPIAQNKSHYAECHHDKFHETGYQNTEYHFDERHFTDCQNASVHYTYSQFADCHSAVCHCAEY
jgi:hypothetical protein